MMTPDERDKLMKEMLENLHIGPVDEDEDVFMTCMSVAMVEQQKTHLVAGSMRIPCFNCKQEVYISPASKKIMEEQNGKAMCFECTKTKLDAEKEVKTHIAPEQIIEAGKDIRRTTLESN